MAGVGRLSECVVGILDERLLGARHLVPPLDGGVMAVVSGSGLMGSWGLSSRTVFWAILLKMGLVGG